MAWDAGIKDRGKWGIRAQQPARATAPPPPSPQRPSPRPRRTMASRVVRSVASRREHQGGGTSVPADDERDRAAQVEAEVERIGAILATAKVEVTGLTRQRDSQGALLDHERDRTAQAKAKGARAKAELVRARAEAELDRARATAEAARQSAKGGTASAASTAAEA